MIKIVILNSLRNEIFKKFKRDSGKVYSLVRGLKDNPRKGKILGQVGKISIRELRHKGFRFYYLIDGNKLDLFDKEKAKELLIKFVRMSKKNDQQRTINKIKLILKRIGFDEIE